MYFVTEIINTGPKTSVERNVRIGGFVTLKGARKQAKKHQPALIRNEQRTIVGQTVSANFPNFI